MDYVFEIADKNKKIIHLSAERWVHIKKHPEMHNKLEEIKEILKNPSAIRYFEYD